MVAILRCKISSILGGVFFVFPMVRISLHAVQSWPCIIAGGPNDVCSSNKAETLAKNSTLTVMELCIQRLKKMSFQDDHDLVAVSCAWTWGCNECVHQILTRSLGCLKGYPEYGSCTPEISIGYSKYTYLKHKYCIALSKMAAEGEM